MRVERSRAVPSLCDSRTWAVALIVASGLRMRCANPAPAAETTSSRRRSPSSDSARCLAVTPRAAPAAKASSASAAKTEPHVVRAAIAEESPTWGDAQSRREKGVCPRPIRNPATPLQDGPRESGISTGAPLRTPPAVCTTRSSVRSSRALTLPPPAAWRANTSAATAGPPSRSSRSMSCPVLVSSPSRTTASR